MLRSVSSGGGEPNWFTSQSCSSEQGPSKKNEYNNPIHISFGVSEVVGLEQGPWLQLTQARVSWQQKVTALRTLYNTPSHSPRKASCASQKTKKQRSGDRVQLQRRYKRFSGGHRVGSHVKRYHPHVKNVNSSC